MHTITHLKFKKLLTSFFVSTDTHYVPHFSLSEIMCSNATGTFTVLIFLLILLVHMAQKQIIECHFFARLCGVHNTCIF